jgi:periplasmic divalent cation tolerance protein
MAGDDYLQVQMTTGSQAEALELARGAVAERLAACGQVSGPVTSVYWWHGEMEQAQEWLVVFKIPADRFTELERFVADKHSYDQPEIIATPIAAGAEGYLRWVREQTR